MPWKHTGAAFCTFLLFNKSHDEIQVQCLPCSKCNWIHCLATFRHIVSLKQKLASKAVGGCVSSVGDLWLIRLCVTKGGHFLKIKYFGSSLLRSMQRECLLNHRDPEYTRYSSFSHWPLPLYHSEVSVFFLQGYFHYNTSKALQSSIMERRLTPESIQSAVVFT